jgi:hypothetical protein
MYIFISDIEAYHPYFVVMTATMTASYLLSLQSLTSVDFNANHRIWASSSDFSQRNIKMDYDTSGDVYQKGFPSVIATLKNSSTACVCVFVNFASTSHKLLKGLERKLNESLCDTDVLHIYGSQDKEEKFWFVRLFCSKVSMEFLNPRVLLATSAANTGIDNNNVIEILRVGFPRDLITYLQERGRACRELNQIGLCYLVADILSLIKTLKMIMIYATDDDDVDHDITGMNCAVQSPSRKIRQVKKSKYSLTDFEQRKKEADEQQDLLDVLNFFCLDLGCQHVRAEWYLAQGSLEPPPCCIMPCKTSCSICTRSYHTRNFIPVYKAPHPFESDSSIPSTPRRQDFVISSTYGFHCRTASFWKVLEPANNFLATLVRHLRLKFTNFCLSIDAGQFR